MDTLLDIAPVGVFVATYYLRGHDIYAATAALMVAMAALLLVDLARKRRIPAMHGLSAALVFALGAATLLLHNQRFIQWKPTVLFWITSVVFALSTWIGRRTAFERLFGEALAELHVPEHLWRALNWQSVGFFAVLGAANLAVAFNASQEVWVNFKFYGLTLATLVFTGLQLAWLVRRTSSPAPGSPAG